MRKSKSDSLTTPDLVLLSLLAERPMYGYEANAELNRRQVRDWAAISRPQIYYSLEKLARQGMIRATESKEPLKGPERQMFSSKPAGRAALAKALEREDWATQRNRPPFLTWMALSWLARPEVVKQQIERRREYLERELDRERTTLQDVLAEVGHSYHEAVWMIKLMIAQFETEFKWLGGIESELVGRRPAKSSGMIGTTHCGSCTHRQATQTHEPR